MTHPPHQSAPPARPGQPMPRPMPTPSPQAPQPQAPRQMGAPAGSAQMPVPVAANTPGSPAPRPMMAPPSGGHGYNAQPMPAAPQAPQGYPAPAPGQQAAPYGSPQAPSRPPSGLVQNPSQPAHPGQPQSHYQSSPHGQPPHQDQHYAPHGDPAGYAAELSDHEGGERALPQLSIHAFCEHNQTASCINQMTRDWRMRRTNTKIYMGGLAAAIDYYHKENTPGLIMFESALRGEQLFSQLETLASVCDEGTRVVMIGATNDIRLYRQLMEKGVSDYIVPPLHPLSMIRSLSDVYADPDKPFTGRAVAFYGSKGGVGSSTLAHNMAWTMSERLMQETALIDLDSSWGTTALDFAYDSASGLEEALADAGRLDDALLDRIMVRHTSRLSILPTSSSLNTKPITDSSAYEAILSAVRSISPLAVLDIPHIWNEWTTNILTTVDDVVITTVPDLANLRNTKNLIDFLKAQRPHDTDPILVLNQTGRCRTKEDEISVDNFAGAVGLEPSLVIGFDPDTFSRACNEGKMLAEMKTTDSLVSGLDYLGHRLRTGEFVDPPTAARGGLKLGRKSKSASKSAGKSQSLIGSLLRRKS